MNPIHAYVAAILLLSGCLFTGGRGADAPDTGSSSDIGAPTDAGTEDGASAADTGTTDSGSTDAGERDLGPVAEAGIVRTRDGLVLYYPFRDDPPGQALDRSGSVPPRDFDLPDGLSQTPGGVGGEFSTIDVRFGDSLVAHLLERQSFTAEVWVGAFAPATPILTLGRFVFSLRLEGNDWDDAAQLSIGPVPARVRNVLAFDRMSHVVVTGENGTIRLYSDGVLVGAWFVDIGGLFTDFNSPPLRIGGVDSHLDLGLIAVYDRALSPGEVLAHNLVGPRPTEADERPERLEPAVATWSEEGVAADGLVVYRTIGADWPDSNWDYDVVAGTNLRGLLLIDTPTPPGELLAARLSGAFDGNNDATGSVSVWQIMKRWQADVSWINATAGQRWEVDGAAGTADRGAMPLHTGPRRATGDPYRFDIDITETARGWLAAPGTNHGFMFTCDTCQHYLDYTSSLDDANRPRIRQLSWARPQGGPPMPPQLVAAETSGTALDVAWTATPNVVEVYVNGRLQARRTTSSTRIELATTTETVELVAVDAWGRTSQRTVVSP